jgi:hypothetical protein
MEYFPNVSWEVYTKDWVANATEMIQLVEELFPESKHMWISTSVSFNDTRKLMSELLNEAARTVVPDTWTYLDTESILNYSLHYRDDYHLNPQSTIPLVNHLLDLAAEANASISLVSKQTALRWPGGGPSWAWGVSMAAPAALGVAAALGGAVVAFRRWGASAHLFRPLDGS